MQTIPRVVAMMMKKLKRAASEATSRSSKEWREDPFVMTIDAVKGYHRVAPAAAGDAEERSGGIV